MACNFTVVYSDDKATRITEFGVQVVKAGHAVRPLLFHDVTLSSESRTTLSTFEMAQVPMSALGLGAFV